MLYRDAEVLSADADAGTARARPGGRCASSPRSAAFAPRSYAEPVADAELRAPDRP